MGRHGRPTDEGARKTGATPSPQTQVEVEEFLSGDGLSGHCDVPHTGPNPTPLVRGRVVPGDELG